MIRKMMGWTVLICLSPAVVLAGQIRAGSPEDKMWRRVTAERAPDAKLQMIVEFEKQFPESKVLTDIYLMAIDVYREKNDRIKVIEYGEKIVKLDDANVSALMILARNYALEGKNLERAVQLGQRALDLIAQMKTQPAPAPLTDAQWKDYVTNTDAAARNIFEYAKALNGGR